MTCQVTGDAADDIDGADKAESRKPCCFIIGNKRMKLTYAGGIHLRSESRDQRYSI